MYYKITNTESEVYKKLHQMRSKEIEMAKENRTLLEEKIGLEWNGFFGHAGQQNLSRVPEYSGFNFTEPDKVDSKIWKRHNAYNLIFVPNTRYKAGREMSDFIRKELKRGWVYDVYDNIGLEHPCGTFTFPFVEICGDVIVLYIETKQKRIEDENIIEITSKEFESILEQ
jgi:hypothetical protein